MFRLTLAFIATFSLCGAQTFPAFNWVQEVDGSGMDQFTGIGTDAAGNVYVVGSTTSPNFPVKNAVQNHLDSAGLANCFVTKLDADGNVVYSTYFGGSGGDAPAAMTVDANGNVYVTGNTGSSDFPTTKGAFAPTFPAALAGTPPMGYVGVPADSVFVFKLNPDGSVGYSTYFAFGQLASSIAVDQNGSTYVAGTSWGGLPTTTGAYQTSFSGPPIPIIPCPIGHLCYEDSFLTRFDQTGSRLIYSTYLGTYTSTSALTVASDGSAYVASRQVVKVDPTGSYLPQALSDPPFGVQAMALAADGSLYMAGRPVAFQPTSGAFQTTMNPLPILPSLPNYPLGSTVGTPDAIVRTDLQHILAGTYFYGDYAENTINSLALDAAGNVYVGGVTASGLPTRTPFFGGFGAGFLSELSGDLTTLLFSSYFGSDNNFGVAGVAAGPNGSIVIGGPQSTPGSLCTAGCAIGSTASNIWVNSLTLAPPPALRIDSVTNAASSLDGPISAGETVVVNGAGFGSDAQLVIGGAAVTAISITSTQITATIPATVPAASAEVTVQAGGAVSNQVLVPVAATSPGLFSQNGNGYGQGYILNFDGTLNTNSNPARPGDRITIYATGVGPLSFTDGYAVSQYPASVFIDGYYCAGVAAYSGPASGFPGDVYRLTIYVPDPPNFTFPALSPVVLQMNGVSSQYGIAISVAQ